MANIATLWTIEVGHSYTPFIIEKRTECPILCSMIYLQKWRPINSPRMCLFPSPHTWEILWIYIILRFVLVIGLWAWSDFPVLQIVKILNLYTPVDEFEERVPISFIRKIQERLKSRPDADNMLLMDAKYTFPITFPYNPSSVALETIEVPETLHIGFVTRV